MNHVEMLIDLLFLPEEEFSQLEHPI